MKKLLIFCFVLTHLGVFSQGTHQFLNINNIRAGFNADGTLFMSNKRDTLIVGVDSFFYEPTFNVPKGTAKNSIFVGNLWVSGIDDGGLLHLAASTYKQGGTDFWAGPIADTYNSTYDSTYNFIWRISKTEIQNHINNFSSTGYVIPWAIATWPGNGNVLNGMPNKLAPFKDLNGNGSYEPALGEYPIILGDQAVFFIFNDGRDIHSETGGPQLEIEIHAMAYAYNDIVNEDLQNTIFINYSIYNRSTRNYNNLQVGLWTDFDMGCIGNELTGCDTLLNTYFVYKALPVDSCASLSYRGYSNFPPAQGVTFLNNEMTSFIRYFNTQNQTNGNPFSHFHYNNYLKGIYKDNSPILRPNASLCSMDSGGTETKFLFHDDPNDTSSTAFSEYNCGGSFTDSKTIGTAGNLSLPAGGKICIDLALPFAQDSNGTHLTSVTKLKERVVALQNFYDNNIVGCEALATSVNYVVENTTSLSIHPNPVNDEFFVNIISNINKENAITVYDINGKLMLTEKTNDNNLKVNTQDWPKGLYIVKSIVDNQSISKRLVKL